MSKSKSPLENLKCITHLRCWQQSPCQAFDPLIPISKRSRASDLRFFHSCSGQFSNEGWGSSSGVINHTDGRGKKCSFPSSDVAPRIFTHLSAKSEIQMHRFAACAGCVYLWMFHGRTEGCKAELGSFGTIKCAEYSRKHWEKMLLKAKVVSTSCVQSKQTN